MKRSPNKLYQFVAAACLPMTVNRTSAIGRSDCDGPEARRKSAGRANFDQHRQWREDPRQYDLNFAALADFVPSLHIADASVNTNIYMRGIGSGNNRGFEQSVGMYLDGVYLGRGRQYRSGSWISSESRCCAGRRARSLVRIRSRARSTSPPASPVVGEAPLARSTSPSKKMAAVLPKALFKVVARRLPLRLRCVAGKQMVMFITPSLSRMRARIDEFGGRVTLVWEPSEVFSANFKYYLHGTRPRRSNSATWRFPESR